MAFEFLKGKRIEKIPTEQFTQLLNTEPDFLAAVEALEKEMIFNRYDPKDASAPADDFEKGENFSQAFRAVQSRLEKLGIRATENAILLEVAKKMDPKNEEGLVTFFDGTFTFEKK